jgi:hypothetical protein
MRGTSIVSVVDGICFYRLDLLELHCHHCRSSIVGCRCRLSIFLVSILDFSRVASRVAFRNDVIAKTLVSCEGSLKGDVCNFSRFCIIKYRVDNRTFNRIVNWNL